MELRKEEIWFLNRATANGCISNDYINSDELNKSCLFDLDDFLNITSGEFVLGRRGYTKLPYKFGIVKGDFDCSDNPLTTMEGFPKKINGKWVRLANINLTSLDFLNDIKEEDLGEIITIQNNPLKDYFKSIKEDDFLHWGKLYWEGVIREYPFLINIGKKYMNRNDLNIYLYKYPQLKIYLE